MNRENKSVVCKYCRSNLVRKYGFVEGTQYYFCNRCRRKFSLNECLFKMKTPYLQVVTALEEYFRGSTIEQIRGKLNQLYNNYPSSRTVYAWINKFTDKAVNKFKDCRPPVISVWVIEMVILRIRNQACRCVDIIFPETCFLLSSGLYANEENQDIRSFVEQALSQVNKMPEKILINDVAGCKEIFEVVYNSKTRHITVDSIDRNIDVQWFEIWKETLMDRNRILERFKSPAAAGKFLKGFRSYYNYLKPQERLDGKTPAEAARVNYSSKNWEDVICKD
jgi:transposase-like protein